MVKVIGSSGSGSSIGSGGGSVTYLDVVPAHSRVEKL